MGCNYYYCAMTGDPSSENGIKQGLTLSSSFFIQMQTWIQFELLCQYT